MNGVVVIPNGSHPCAVIERRDNFIMVVEPLNGGRLELMDVVEVGDLQAELKMTLQNLTAEVPVEVLVRRVGVDLSWEEKLNLRGEQA